MSRPCWCVILWEGFRLLQHRKFGIRIHPLHAHCVGWMMTDPTDVLMALGPKLSGVRNNQPEAIDILRFERPDWVYIPIAQTSPEVLLQRLFVKTIAKKHHLVHFDADVQVTFYTDGGAIHPTDPVARLASWAVVSDVSCVSEQDIQNISEFMGQSMLCPLIRVVGCGLVYGHQSAARGELIAFLKALTAAQKYNDSVQISVVTDASYVCFVDFALCRQLPKFPDHRVKNADIIQDIKEVWHPRIKS